jgi:hypothetical protein
MKFLFSLNEPFLALLCNLDILITNVWGFRAIPNLGDRKDNCHSICRSLLVSTASG